MLLTLRALIWLGLILGTRVLTMEVMAAGGRPGHHLDGVLYTSFTLFAVAASPVVRWPGTGRALVVGTSGYLLFILVNLVPKWYTTVPASLYMGFTASIIWVGQVIGNLISCGLLRNGKAKPVKLLALDHYTRMSTQL